MEQGEGRIEEGCGKETKGNYEQKELQSDIYSRPDLILEGKKKNKVLVCDKACSQQANIAAKIKCENDKVSTTCICIKREEIWV